MKVLVTGAAGYLGSVLCGKLLEAGHDVLAVDNLMYGQQSLLHLAENPRFEFRNADVLDLDWWMLSHECDVVIPLAAIVGADACDARPWLATAINASAVLDAVGEFGGACIYPNTNSGYGTTDGAPCTEETPMNPISRYGEVKCYAEEDVLNHGGTVFRLATLFGASPRMRWSLLVNSYVRDALARAYIYVWDRRALRNYVHVEDVAAAFIWALDAPRGVYNLGNDALNCTKLELAQAVVKQVGGQVFYDDAEDRHAELRDPDKRNYTVSSAKLRAAGFEATRGWESLRGVAQAYWLTKGVQE